MEKYLFARALLNRLADARFCYRLLAGGLRVAAGLLGLFSIVTFFQVGRIVSALPAQSILGGVLFELFFVLAVYAAVHVALIRAQDIEALAPDGPYAIRATVVLSRLVGEAYFCFVSLVGIGTGLFVWFTASSHYKVLGPSLRQLFPTRHEDASFLGGIEFILSGLLFSLTVLIASYVIAEALSLLLRAGAGGTARVAAGNGRQTPEQSPYKPRLGA